MLRAMRCLLWLVVAPTLGGVCGPRAAHCAERHEMRGLAPTPDTVCGPRCVQYVLESFGIPERLTALVREIQGPEIEQGSSLYSLSLSLERRGVHTRMVRVPRGVALHWQHPVILHLAGSEGTMGHFVVGVGGARAGHTPIWTGLGGLVNWPTDDLQARMSGAVLLTSPSPITRVDLASGPEGRRNLVAAASGCAFCAVLSLCWRSVRRRRIHRSCLS